VSLLLVDAPDGVINWNDRALWMTPPFNLRALGGAAIMKLTLRERSPSLTLDDRSPSLGLVARTPSLTLPVRDC
jgi:hypothetical protein